MYLFGFLNDRQPRKAGGDRQGDLVVTCVVRVSWKDNNMQFTQLFDDNRAVSPVIGVILMVAITVILAAVIGTFVLGLSDQVGDTAPQASFGFDSPSAGNASVTITHEQGAEIESDLNVRYTNTTGGDVTEPWSGPISAGDFHTTNESVLDGTTVRVVWTSDSGDTATMGKFEK